MPGMFCQKCKSLMFPKDGKMFCRNCGGEQEAQETKITTEQKVSDLADYEDGAESIDILPKTRIECPKCENKEAFWYLRQTRAADEPTTRFYTCTKCGHKWREY